MLLLSPLGLSLPIENVECVPLEISDKIGRYRIENVE